MLRLSMRNIDYVIIFKYVNFMFKVTVIRVSTGALKSKVTFPYCAPHVCAPPYESLGGSDNKIMCPTPKLEFLEQEIIKEF